MSVANRKHQDNLKFFVSAEGPTIKKDQLSRLIGNLPDNADIYLFTKLDSVHRAVELSAQLGTEVLSFSLTGDVIEEAGGVSLVAKAAKPQNAA